MTDRAHLVETPSEVVKRLPVKFEAMFLDDHHNEYVWTVRGTMQLINVMKRRSLRWPLDVVFERHNDDGTKSFVYCGTLRNFLTQRGRERWLARHERGSALSDEMYDPSVERIVRRISGR